MSASHGTGPMPTAYVVTNGTSPPVRARMREALAPLRAPFESAVALLFGMWPLWAVLGLGMLLVWATAMGDSP